MIKTKKRTLILSLFALIMAICMAFGVKSLIPVLQGHASDAHVHCFCGSNSCSKNLHDSTLDWVEWDGKSDLTVSKNYYLADNVGADEITADIIVSADANLCLHGKTLDLGSYGLIIEEGVNLTICDCVGDGTITSHRIFEDNVGFIFGTIELSGTLNLYSGTLTHFKSDSYISANFCAVSVFKTGLLNVFGGTITGEYSLSIYNLGNVVIDGGLITSRIDNGLPFASKNYPEKLTVVNPATLTLKSGQINYTNAVINAGIFNVEGGSINAEQYAVQLYFGGELYQKLKEKLI